MLMRLPMFDIVNVVSQASKDLATVVHGFWCRNATTQAPAGNAAKGLYTSPSLHGASFAQEL